MKVLKMRCPHCHQVSVVDETSVKDTIYCSFCGSQLLITRKEEEKKELPQQEETFENELEEEKPKIRRLFDLDHILDYAIVALSCGILSGLIYIFVLMNTSMIQ